MVRLVLCAEDGKIEYKEFKDIFRKLKFRITVNYKSKLWIEQKLDPWINLTTKKWWCDLKDRLRNREEKAKFERIVDVVLAVNSVTVVIQSMQDLADTNTYESDKAWGCIEFGFSLFYLFEILVKVLAQVPSTTHWASRASCNVCFVAPHSQLASFGLQRATALMQS